MFRPPSDRPRSLGLAPIHRYAAELRDLTGANAREGNRFWMSAVSRIIIVGGVLN